MDPATERHMLGLSPADLTPAQVQEWLAAAFGGADAADALRWILPRVLDLLASGAAGTASGHPVALARLPLAGFPAGWTDAEVAAVTAACLHVMDRHIAERRGGLDDLMCMFSRAGMAVDPFLARLDALPDDVLADLLDIERQGWRQTEIRQSAFWQSPADRNRVLAWLTGWPLLDRMHGAGLAGNRRAARVADALDAVARSGWPD